MYPRRRQQYFWRVAQPTCLQSWFARARWALTLLISCLQCQAAALMVLLPGTGSPRPTVLLQTHRIPVGQRWPQCNIYSNKICFCCTGNRKQLSLMQCSLDLMPRSEHSTLVMPRAQGYAQSFACGSLQKLLARAAKAQRPCYAHQQGIIQFPFA